jgi:tRNA-binding protein
MCHLPLKQIGKFMSEVLVLGFPDQAGNVVLVSVSHTVPNGGKLF